MRRAWTTDEDAVVRREYACGGSHAVRAILPTRTRPMIASRAKHLGIACAARYWTEEEKAIVREWYGKIGCKQVAERLSANGVRFSVKQVYLMALKLGVTYQRRARVDAAWLARLCEMNAQGLPDTILAERLGCNRHTVTRHRQAMGLPSHARGEHLRQAIVRTTAETCRRHGVANLGQLKSKCFRDFARANGWPEECRPREVMILNELARLGPMTRPQLAAAIGLRWTGSRNTFVNKHVPGGSYLAHLQRLGFVLNMGKARFTGRGKGTSLGVYCITMKALEYHRNG